MIEYLFWSLAVVVVLHLFFYPSILAMLSRLKSGEPVPTPINGREGPAQGRPTTDGCSVTVIVPAYNEERFMAAKIADLQRLHPANGSLRIVVGFDGCTDRSVEEARAALSADGNPVDLSVFDTNRGKVAVLNQLIGEVDSDVVVLSDVSARLPADAVRRLAAHFTDPTVGAVGAGYQLARAGSRGEAIYWRYQTWLKGLEASIGAPMGLHGACYAFRRSAWAPLPLDTINDDFVLPMRLVAAGWRAVYDPSIEVVESERTRPGQDWARRRRIGAGNWQQVMRCWRLVDPRRPGVALTFILGKATRAALPIALVLLVVLNLLLGEQGSWFYRSLMGIQLGFYALALWGMAFVAVRSRLLAWPAYFVAGNTASLMGIIGYVCGSQVSTMQMVARTKPVHHHSAVEFGKRLFDLALGLTALIPLGLLFIPLALAIRLESPGPIFYRQLRVGRAWPDRTDLIQVWKFRSMRADAERQTGAVLAGRDDPRITRVGRFIRKTRLDELPQAINVVRGEMSIVGPRPERPAFFPRLEAEIPFYSERVFALKPGITGLAQVNQGYDETLDDVRNKVLLDHSYALRIGSLGNWLRTDLAIIGRTVLVMVMGKGR